ncbi:hypothetical protein IFR05_005552 [Cadophora sp. M221]|nr:hypothetical protein IFR05_005552 [Cadophora sp. M221]
MSSSIAGSSLQAPSSQSSVTSVSQSSTAQVPSSRSVPDSSLIFGSISSSIIPTTDVQSSSVQTSADLSSSVSSITSSEASSLRLSSTVVSPSTIAVSSEESSTFRSSSALPSTPSSSISVTLVISSSTQSLLESTSIAASSSASELSSTIAIIPSTNQISSVPASSTLSATGCASTPPAPTNPGTPADCCQYYVVQFGDTCSVIASRFGTTVEEFEAWNPGINPGCTNLNPNFAVVSYSSGQSSSIGELRSSSVDASEPTATSTATDQSSILESRSSCVSSTELPSSISSGTSTTLNGLSLTGISSILTIVTSTQIATQTSLSGRDENTLSTYISQSTLVSLSTPSISANPSNGESSEIQSSTQAGITPSVTNVVQSTAQLPVPGTITSASAGPSQTPVFFQIVVEMDIIPKLRKRADNGTQYVGPGSSFGLDNCNDGYPYTYKNDGQLMAGGEFVSTNSSAAWMYLVPETITQPITTTFAVDNDGTLSWNNTLFEGEEALCCQESDGQVAVLFRGATDMDLSYPAYGVTCTPIKLKAVTPSTCDNSTISSSMFGSSTAGTSISLQSTFAFDTSSASSGYSIYTSVSTVLSRGTTTLET